MNLSERVAQLEKELAALRPYNDVTPRNSRVQAKEIIHIDPLTQPASPLNIPSFLPSLSTTTPEGLPVLSLFDNNILTASEPNKAIYDSVSREFGTDSTDTVNHHSTSRFRTSRIKRGRICDALTSLLPSQSAICEILETGGLWWDLLRILHPHMCCEDDQMTIQTYVLLALNQDNPCILGSALSWLAMSLQGLPMSYDTSHLDLPLPHDALAQHYVSTIDRLIVCDDEVSLSLEGTECVLLQAQFYGNVGRPRKAWSITRKALSHAVLIGLYKFTSRTPASPSPHCQRRESVWWHLVQSDAYVSLMLGLQGFTQPPIQGSHVDILTGADFITQDVYRKRLFALISKISDRNQAMQCSSEMTLMTTTEIDRELEALSTHLQPMKPLHLDMPAPVISVRNTFGNYETMIAHFWTNQAKVYLHLPFMLRDSASSGFDHSRTACISGARAVLQLYISMRAFVNGRVNLCRLLDFQVSTAAVIVILGLLGYRPMTTLRDRDLDAQDWGLVYQTMEILRMVSPEPDNLIATQCLQALEALVSIANGQISTSGQACGRKILIPYFGIIKVAAVSNITTSEMTQGAAPDLQHDLPMVPRTQANFPNIDIDVFNALCFGNGSQQNLAPRSEDPSDCQSLDILAMDIDQDWSWMLNGDYQVSAQVEQSQFAGNETWRI